MKKRPKVGDILEISLVCGCGYLLYLGNHSEYGEVVRVLNDLPSEKPDEFHKQFAAGYIVFYPVKAAVRQGLVRIVGNREVAQKIPSILRRPGVIDNNGQVITWVIEGDGQEFVVEDLSPHERQIPIAEIWNHEALCLKINTDWRPEQEG